MNSRYLEIDSTYRNRNLYPLASNFIIPIAQSGNKGYREALDPVSLEMPVFAWSSNYLDISTASIKPWIIEGFVDTSNPSIQYESDSGTFIISTFGKFQQLKNYYKGLILSGITNSEVPPPPAPKRRIIESKYMGSYEDSTSSQIIDMTQITVSSAFIDSNPLSAWRIEDPSYISSVEDNLSFLFVPSGGLQDNTYINYKIYNEIKKNFTDITSYDGITHMIKFYVPKTYNWSTTHNYSLRIQPPSLSPDNTTIDTSKSTKNKITMSNGSNLSQYFGYYSDYFLRILPAKYSFDKVDKGKQDNKTYNNQARKINQYVGDINEPKCYIDEYGKNICKSYSEFYPDPYTFYVNNPFTEELLDSDTIEILKFSYDNYQPFVYTGSTVSQQEMVCYKIELLDIILPNEILSIGAGSRIAYYPYVYVEISNVSSSGAGLKNIIYSNNPNSSKAIFRVPIYDIVNPSNSAFVKVDGDGMVQTIKFKPNDNLQFSVTLPTGEYYETILQEYFSPSMPNVYCQISACFSMERI
jgi:hypothetical protein